MAWVLTILTLVLFAELVVCLWVGFVWVVVFCCCCLVGLVFHSCFFVVGVFCLVLCGVGGYSLVFEQFLVTLQLSALYPATGHVFLNF